MNDDRLPACGGRPMSIWAGCGSVWRRRCGVVSRAWLERVAGRLLRSPGLARALVTTPSLLLRRG